MTYQDNFKKWLDYAELPDYLREDLNSMDEKTKEDAFTPILSLVLLVCVV